MSGDEFKQALHSLAERYEQGLEHGDIDGAADFLSYAEGVSEQDIEVLLEELEQGTLTDELTELARGISFIYRWAPLLVI